jgi:membrane fusion protein (multidrug efflux system)
MSFFGRDMTPTISFLRPLVGCLLFSAIFSACGGDGASGKSQGAGAPGAAPPAKLAAIVLAPSSSGSGTSAPGTVLAEQQVDIQAEISGRVTYIGFSEGQPVKAGQVLIRLEDSELKAKADQADARLLLARTREERLRQDFKAQAVSQGEYDQASAEWKSARAEAALARSQWEKTFLRAPFAGSTGLREIDLGSVVQPGTRLTTVQNLNSLRVDFSVPENQARIVKTGMKVRFTVAGSPDTLDATVYAVESRIDPDTRLLRVRARCEKPGGRVLPGSFARVELPQRQDSSLWIPTQAVVQSARGSQVWTVKGGKAELKPFTPGTRDAQSVEAVSGLSAGDTVLVSGLLQLRPAAPVIPVVSGSPVPDSSTASR